MDNKANKRSMGIMRNKTYILQDFREDIKKKNNRFKNFKKLNKSEEELFIEKTVQPLSPMLNKNDFIVELSQHDTMETDSPDYMQIYSDIENKLKELESLYKEITKLNVKRLKDQLDVDETLDFQIYEKNNKATQIIQLCEKNLKKINNLNETAPNNSKNEESASKIQEYANNFRKKQKELYNHLKKLNEKMNPGFLSNSSEKFLEKDDREMFAAQDFMNEIAHERDEEINKLIDAINELTHVFKLLENLVIEQGTVLDRIDFNMEEAYIQVKKGTQKLKQADTYQKSNRARNCILILLVLIAIFFIVLVVKISN